MCAGKVTYDVFVSLPVSSLCRLCCPFFGDRALTAENGRKALEKLCMSFAFDSGSDPNFFADGYVRLFADPLGVDLSHLG